MRNKDDTTKLLNENKSKGPAVCKSQTTSPFGSLNNLR